MGLTEILIAIPLFALVLGGNYFYFKAVSILKKNGRKASWWSPMYNTSAFSANLKHPENQSKLWFPLFKKSVLIYRIVMGLWITVVLAFFIYIFTQTK